MDGEDNEPVLERFMVARRGCAMLMEKLPRIGNTFSTTYEVASGDTLRGRCLKTKTL